MLGVVPQRDHCCCMLAQSIEPYRGIDTAIRVIVPTIANVRNGEARIRDALDAYLGGFNGETRELLWRGQNASYA